LILLIACTSAWSQVSSLEPPPGSRFDAFGYSVAVDQTTAVVGAPHNDVQGSGQGAAYVFEQRGQRWQRVATLQASNASPGDQFGFSVDVEGNRILVGAIHAFEERGRAYLFERTEQGWQEVAILKASNRQPLDHFGWSVRLAAARILVTRHAYNCRLGAAYVFEDLGSGWVETARFDSLAEDCELGFSSDIEGDTIVVGSPKYAGPTRLEGLAHVYEWQQGQWSESLLKAPDPDRFEQATRGLALSGSRIAVGAPLRNEVVSGGGCVYLYERQADGWQLTDKILPPVAIGGLHFGYHLDLCGDRLVVGCGSWSQITHPQFSCFVYEFQGGSWQYRSALSHGLDAGGNDEGGQPLRLDGETVLIGSERPYPEVRPLSLSHLLRLGSLRLQVTPDQVTSGDAVTFAASDGVIDQPLVVVLTSVDGQSTFQPLALGGSLDAYGEWSTTITAFTGGSGVVGLRALSIDLRGQLELSPEAYVRLR
jgi:hypothetical protein